MMIDEALNMRIIIYNTLHLIKRDELQKYFLKFSKNILQILLK